VQDPGVLSRLYRSYSDLIGSMSTYAQEQAYAAGDFVQDVTGSAVAGALTATYIQATAGAPIGLLGIGLLPEQVMNSVGEFDHGLMLLADGVEQEDPYRAWMGVASVAGAVGTVAGAVVTVAGGVAAAAKGKAAGAKGAKTYQTYTKTNPETGQVYSGRTSGRGTPAENVARRDATHHADGFGPAELDRSSSSRAAIRGREQQLIDTHGGAQSAGGTSGNVINGISSRNPLRSYYLEAARREFGP
jgi:hypothetical protein